ncbi:MAG: hypothetical protein BroJett021_26950 [Chloroflexota bacterium]|jgi:transcriptional regulator with XRE-family HTH domain|nr:helix-turn-helix domain-containing protein [Caldilinea sp.]GIK73707.1 MAG: hypothetical protein BroJett021_26950 [Chloroflexota bacterium]
MKRFGEKLHALRIHHSLTLSELAKKLGYQSHSYVTEIEAGRKMPTALLVLKIADLFDVSTDQLLRDQIEVDLSSSKLRKNE